MSCTQIDVAPMSNGAIRAAAHGLANAAGHCRSSGQVSASMTIRVMCGCGKGI